MRYLLFLFLILIGTYACKTSQYPTTGNYASKTKINIIGNYPDAEKKILQQKLERQIDDSLVYSKQRKTWLGFVPYYVKVYHNFDTNSISRTKSFFKAAYIANGYFRGDTTLHTVSAVKKESKAYLINFSVYPNKNHTINKITLDLKDSTLQQLANTINATTLLKKGDLYTQEALDAERRRLVTHFRNEGYLFFTKDEIKVIADTINTALLKFTNDPFEQQELLLKADSFNRNPTTNITIALKDTVDPIRLKKYYVGNITIEPDNMDTDTTPPNKQLVIYNTKHSDKIEGQKFKRKKYFTLDTFYKAFFVDKYNSKVFKNKIYLRKGELYNETNVEKTTTSLNSLNNFKQVIITAQDKTIRNDTIDFRINMLPYDRFLREQKIEGSYSQNNLNNNNVPNLFGINVSLTFKDRNANKKAIQSTFTAIAGIEFGRNDTRKNILNTIQGGINYNRLFPNVKLLKSLNLNKTVESAKSFYNINANYTSRLSFFRLAEVGASYGSNFIKRTEKNKLLNIQTSLPTFEYKRLEASALLNNLINATPSLRNIYRSGIIISPIRTQISYERLLKNNLATQRNKKSTTRYAAELSGLGFKNVLPKDLFSFVKIEVDKRFFWNKPKYRSVAMRGYLGFGTGYNKSLEQNKTMPFFRQFVSGGPNSLRAWALRTLSSYSTRNSSTNIQEYFGDIQAEFNVEYRYRWGKVLGIPVAGALFIDAGNIWNWNAIEDTLVPYDRSKLQRTVDDIAIASGTSVRFDFDYFIIRLDLGVKIKDPRKIDGSGGWLTKENFSINNNPVKLQLGIGYPF